MQKAVFFLLLLHVEPDIKFELQINCMHTKQTDLEQTIKHYVLLNLKISNCTFWDIRSFISLLPVNKLLSHGNRLYCFALTTALVCMHVRTWMSVAFVPTRAAPGGRCRGGGWGPEPYV